MSFRLFLSITLALALTLPFGGHAQERVVQTVSDFRQYTELHRARVHLLAREALRREPQRFATVTPELLDRYIALHDRNKLTPEFLEPLFGLYGRNVAQMSESEAAQARGLIDRFNAADAEEVRGFFEKHPEARLAQEQLQLLEKIADFVDRGSSPLSPEEFGRPMLPASRFFKPTDPRDLQLMQELEREYPQLTSGHHWRRPELPCLSRGIRSALIN